MKDRLADLRGLSSKPLLSTPSNHDVENGEDRPLLAGETYTLEKFLSTCSLLSSKLTELDNCLSTLENIYREILVHQDQELDNKLNALDATFKQECKFVISQTKDLDNNVKAGQSNSVDSRIKESQMATIRKRLANIATKYNTDREKFEHARNKAIMNYMKIQGFDVSDEVIIDAIEHGTLPEMSKGLVLAVADKKALYEDVKNRRDQLLKLEKSVRELNDMFQDLFFLVTSQGEMMDNIERHVEAAVDYSTKAKDNVIAARDLQKKARKMKILICIALIILVIVLFFVLQGIVCHFTPIC